MAENIGGLDKILAGSIRKAVERSERDIVDVHKEIKIELEKAGINYEMERCNKAIVKLVGAHKILMWKKYKSYNEGFTFMIAKNSSIYRERMRLDEAEAYDMTCWLYGVGDYSQD